MTDLNNMKDELSEIAMTLQQIEWDASELAAARRRRKIGRLGAALIALMVVSGIAAAAVYITQTFPPVGVVGLTTTCQGPLNPSNASVIVNTSGHLLFQCGSNPAFHAIGGTVAVPSFVLPQGYVSLWIYPSATPDGLTCSDFAETQVTPGANVLFPLSQNYNYCVEYANPPAGGLSGFTITWSES